MCSVTVKINKEGFEEKFAKLSQEVTAIEADETYEVELLDTDKKHSFLGRELTRKLHNTHRFMT